MAEGGFPPPSNHNSDLFNLSDDEGETLPTTTYYNSKISQQNDPSKYTSKSSSCQSQRASCQPHSKLPILPAKPSKKKFDQLPSSASTISSNSCTVPLHQGHIVKTAQSSKYRFRNRSGDGILPNKPVPPKRPQAQPVPIKLHADEIVSARSHLRQGALEETSQPFGSNDSFNQEHTYYETYSCSPELASNSQENRKPTDVSKLKPQRLRSLSAKKAPFSVENNFNDEINSSYFNDRIYPKKHNMDKSISECQQVTPLMQNLLTKCTGRKFNKRMNIFPVKSRVKCSDNSKFLADKKGSPGFETLVYMKISEEISSSLDIEGYISNRIGGSFEFSIINKFVDTKENNTTLTVKFSSKRKAIKAMSHIQMGNPKSNTKIYCSFDEATLSGVIARDDDKMKKFLENQINEVTTRSRKILHNHDTKLRDLQEALLHINNVIKSNRFMPISEFEIANAERKAIKDKVNEMELQRQEFDLFVTKMLSEMESASGTKESDKRILVIRRQFGIECARMTDCLPMYARRTEIIDTVRNNQVSIIIGETGSGKSTQMTQFLYEAGLSTTGLIACTQPRKIAAINLAMHVSKQMAEKVGGLIGYQCGMNVKKNKETQILYMTDHALLNECLKDANLSAYSCIIIDEAHERSIYTDLLIGMLKNCLSVRPDLHIVVTSATINPGVFLNYFGQNTPILRISGRAYPVEVIWNPHSDEEEFKNYEVKAVNKAVDIHNDEPPGHILIFLTTPLEVERCCDMFTKRYNPQKKCICLQLHGKISAEEQQKVFKEYGDDTRKVIFATNAAETSITIPNVKYVVDTGFVKEMNYDTKRSLNTLNTSIITQSSAQQRKGRAGRTAPGKCYRLYTEDTFNKMRENSVPEILRIHLGHALLKLLQLRVHPNQFDFVESPSLDALDIAMESLEDLKAVINGKITALGQWIANIPLEPHFGAFLYYAIQENVGTEALIIASTCCSPGSVFFRAGSDKEKDKADKLKSIFCRPGGDLLTNLQVYREWLQKSERDKNVWCMNNSLNSKSLRGIRETAKEIVKLLKIELNISLKETLDNSNIDDVECKLQRLLFRIFHANLCHFLGHEKAGYLFISKEQQVHLFPSSALLALGSWPEWITFIQVMQTSRQFAMNVLPVSEENVLQGIKEGWIQFDIESVKKKRLQTVCTTLIGKSMYNEFVGPRYSSLRQLENEIQANCNGSIAIIDANREQGIVKVYCIEEHTSAVSKDVKEYAQPIRDKYKEEEKEECVGQEGSGIRAILKAGGQVTDILMPDEYFTVQVFTNTVEEMRTLTTNEVTTYFKQFGDIDSCIELTFRTKPRTLWGTVTFKTSSAAKLAIETQPEEGDLIARLNRKIISSTANTQFSAKLTWERRKSRGFGFVEFREIEEVPRALGHLINVAGNIVKVQPSKKGANQNEVFIGGLNNHVTEDVLRAEIARSMELHPTDDIRRVQISRTQVKDTKEGMATIHRRITCMLESICKDKKKAFYLNLLPTKDGSYDYIAYVHFTNAEDGYKACQEINDNFLINDRIVKMVPQLKTKIFIHSLVLKSVNNQLQHLLTDLQNNYNIQIKQHIQRNGNLLIDISSEIVDVLGGAKSQIENLVKGDIIEFGNESQVNQFFTWDGRQVINSIEVETASTILLDRRMYTVTVYGTMEQRRAAKTTISKYLENSANRISKQIKLSGFDKPIGVMRALLLKYGCLLIDLKLNSKLHSVDLLFRTHTLILVGDQKAIDAAVQLVDELVTSLRRDQNDDREEVEDEDMNCSICWCPVDSALYRLEYCGHAYCDICLRQKTNVGVRDREFPFLCGKDGCNEPFVWRDFVNLFRLNIITIADLVSASVAHHVAHNKKSVKYCLTPDCEMVYKATSDGRAFRCPLCALIICTTCDVQYHDGLSCAMYRGMKKDKDYSLKEWQRQDPNNRKQCPSCSTPIEKNNGCVSI